MQSFGGDKFGVGAVTLEIQHAEDLIPLCKTGNFRANGRNDAGDIPAGDQRKPVLQPLFDMTGTHFPVQGVNAGGMDFDKNFTRGRFGAGDFIFDKDFGIPIRM